MCTEVCLDSRTIGKDPLPNHATRIVEKRTEFDLLCCSSTFNIPFRLKLMARILKTADDMSNDASGIAVFFFFALFKRDGLHAIAIVVASLILAVEGFRRICPLSEKNIKNCNAFLQFLALVTEHCALESDHAGQIAQYHTGLTHSGAETERRLPDLNQKGFHHSQSPENKTFI
jgi:hypothetical protein